MNTVELKLDPRSIQRVINTVQNLGGNTKINRIVSRVADRLQAIASEALSSAVVDRFRDKVTGVELTETMALNVKKSVNGNTAMIYTDQQEAVFVEFGTGVHYNGGAVGGSTHPLGTSLGLTVGTYGEGHGAQEYWWFEGFYTQGMAAQMPLYNAFCANIEGIKAEIIAIAKDVLMS